MKALTCSCFLTRIVKFYTVQFDISRPINHYYMLCMSAHRCLSVCQEDDVITWWREDDYKT